MWEAVVVIFAMSFMVGFVIAIVGLFIGFIRRKWRVSIIGGIICGASFAIMMIIAGMGGLLDETNETTSTERDSDQLVAAAPTHIPTSAPQPTPVPPTPIPPTFIPPTLTPEPTLTSTPVPPTPIPPTSTPTPVPPTPTPTPINPDQIVNDYQTNETAAELKWKTGERLFVILENIDEIKSEGRVQKSISLGGSFSFDFAFIVLDFSKDADVVDLTPGDTVTAYCKFVGYDHFIGDWFEFEDCTRHR